MKTSKIQLILEQPISEIVAEAESTDILRLWQAISEITEDPPRQKVPAENEAIRR